MAAARTFTRESGANLVNPDVGRWSRRVPALVDKELRFLALRLAAGGQVVQRPTYLCSAENVALRPPGLGLTFRAVIEAFTALATEMLPHERTLHDVANMNPVVATAVAGNPISVHRVGIRCPIPFVIFCAHALNAPPVQVHNKRKKTGKE